MSSRQLRKIRQQQELLGAAKPEDDAASESEDEVPVSKPRVSMFAALGGDDDNDDEDEEEQEEPEQVAERDDTPVAEQAQPAIAAKKRRKKKKGKNKQGDKQGGNKAPATTSPDEDEIDRALKELNIQPRASPDSPAGAEQEDAGVLAINPYNLKAIHEMKALFGREIIEAARAEEAEEDQATRRRLLHGGARQVDLETFLKGDPGRKLPEVTLRRNMFIQGKDNWPRAAAGGLVMREVGTDGEGATEFAFVHEKQYDVVQSIFFHCVGIGDPMRMVHLLKQFPYHISTLLQVSAFAKQDQNQALAADLCERALFTFGRVTLSSFRRELERGKARLDFRRPENRQFWLAGYHYLKSLMRKGTYRTALEWAKLLFSLDPEGDPYGMNHFIHILAVRSRETDWLEGFIETFESGPLHGEMRYYRNSLVLGWIGRQEDDRAKARLVEEMEATPWVYCALFQTLGLDAPPSIWGVQPPGEVDEFYTTLYVEMTKDMWNFPRYTTVLKAAADAATKKKEAEPTNAVLELRTARFVYLEGNTKMLGLVPRQYLDRQPNYEFDPLPPAKEENVFEGRGVALPWEGEGDERARVWMRGLEARAQRGAAGGGGAGAGAGAGGAAGEDWGEEEEIPDEIRDVIFGGGAESGSELEDDDAGLEGLEGLEGAPSIQQSIYDTLMDIFGRRAAGREGAEEGAAGGEGAERAERAEPSGLPGAWPADEGEEEGGERGAEGRGSG